MKGKQKMKNQNIVVIAVASALAFALTAVTEALPNPGGIASQDSATNAPSLGGGANSAPTNELADSASPQDAALPVITIHSAGNILRGNTGSFVLKMNSPAAFGGMYVNFKVSGTAIPGVDYVSLRSPAYIGPTGYGVISLKTLPNPRGSAYNTNYSVVVTLEPGAGYALGAPSSALIWISTSCVLEACW